MSKQYRPGIAVLFDDHQLFSGAFSAWLEKLELFQRVYTFNSKEELLRFFYVKHPEKVYLISDFYLREGTSLIVLKDIKRIYPAVRLIILSSITNPDLIKKIMELNPRGFLTKTAGMNEVMECISHIDQDKAYISPFFISLLIKNPGPIKTSVSFTARELEVLDCFAKGNSIAETAQLLNLSTHTIVSHRRNMMAKTKTNSIVKLLAYAHPNDPL